MDPKVKKDDQNVPEIVKRCNNNDIAGVKDLLICGRAEVNDKDDNGMTPLQHAAYKGQFELCTFLIDYGADVNADSHDHGYSCLHFAALSGNSEIVCLLLCSGAKAYHTNTLNRTAAQMAAFVGNHAVVALINNFIPFSEIQYYTSVQGLETEPKLLLEAANSLYNLIMQTNLNPVFIAITVEKSPMILKHLTQCRKVLSLLCEKETKQSENINEIKCLKMYYLSHVLEVLDKEHSRQLEQDDSDKADGDLPFDALIRAWLRPRDKEGLERQQENVCRAALRSFPYTESPLFVQVLRQVASGNVDALQAISAAVNGQRAFASDKPECTTCGSEAPNEASAKRCAQCRSVTYCDRECQRRHWRQHKKKCVPAAAKDDKTKTIDDEKTKTTEGHQTSTSQETTKDGQKDSKE